MKTREEEVVDLTIERIRKQSMVDSILARSKILTPYGDEAIKASDKIRHLYSEIAEIDVRLARLKFESEAK